MGWESYRLKNIRPQSCPIPTLSKISTKPTSRKERFGRMHFETRAKGDLSKHLVLAKGQVTGKYCAMQF